MKECCGNCRWWEKDGEDGDHVCVNDESENLADWTEWNDSCDGWERKIWKVN